VTELDIPRADVPRASVVMVTYGGWRWTRHALEALRERTDEPFELLVVDNDSSDDTAERLRDDLRGATVILNEENVGFAAAANQGAARARGAYLVFLNPDCMVQPGWLSPLLRALEDDPWADAAVPRMFNSDGTVQEAGGLVFSDGGTMLYGFGADPDLPRYRFRRYVDYGSAACLAIRREAFHALGGFDPVYRPAYCEDVDLLLTLRAAGRRTVFEPAAEVVHIRFGSSVTGEERVAMSRRNTSILRERWADFLADRPSLPKDTTEAHLVLASRDADATDRVLVLADEAPEPFLTEIARLNRLGRVTYLATGFREPHGDVVARLAGAGVEVEGPLDDHDTWWRERLFHYTAVVVPGPEPTWLRRRLHETQPQASLIAGRHPEALVAELRRVGLLAEPTLPGEQAFGFR
jgi:O-antigen biosynthesis protein